MCNQQAFHQKIRSHHARKRKRRAHFFEQWAKHKGFGQHPTYPPVNVLEEDDKYHLFLYAPELTKADFKIVLTDRLLSISAEAKEKPAGNWRRREFEAGGFKRQFELNEKIDTEGIAAEYKEGILKVTLQKLEGFTSTRSDITVA